MNIPKADGTKLGDITTYQAGVVQANVHRILQKRCDEILKPYGISKNHWLIIGMVLDAGPKGIRISELAKQVGTTLPYLTNAINMLELKGILNRKSHEADNRSKFVTIDKSFLPKVQKIEETLRQGLRQSVYSKVSIEEFHTYMKVLYKLQITEG